jgi:hypothetical protein
MDVHLWSPGGSPCHGAHTGATEAHGRAVKTNLAHRRAMWAHPGAVGATLGSGAHPGDMDAHTGA